MAERLAVRKPDGLSLGGRRSPTGAAVMQEETDLDWDALYADQAPRVYNYFRFRLGGADVEDLTARTFEKAWRSRGRYRRDLAGFSTWLFKIAHNVALDYLQTLRSHLPIDAAADVAAERTPERDAERDSEL